MTGGGNRSASRPGHSVPMHADGFGGKGRSGSSAPFKNRALPTSAPARSTLRECKPTSAIGFGVAHVGASCVGSTTLDNSIILENPPGVFRSEEHTSELQSRLHLVC